MKSSHRISKVKRTVRRRHTKRKKIQRGGNGFDMNEAKIGKFIKFRNGSVDKIINIIYKDGLPYQLELQYFGKLNNPKETTHITVFTKKQLDMNGAELLEDGVVTPIYMTNAEKNAERTAAAKLEEERRVAKEKREANRRAAEEKLESNRRATEEKREANRRVVEERERAIRKAAELKAAQNKARETRKISEREGEPRRKFNIGQKFIKESPGLYGIKNTDTIKIEKDAYIMTNGKEVWSLRIKNNTEKLQPGSETTFVEYDGQHPTNVSGVIKEYAYHMSNGSIYSESELSKLPRVNN